MNPIKAAYNIQGQNFERVPVVRDLAVLMEGKLNYMQKIQRAITAARRNAGLITRH